MHSFTILMRKFIWHISRLQKAGVVQNPWFRVVNRTRTTSKTHMGFYLFIPFVQYYEFHCINSCRRHVAVLHACLRSLMSDNASSTATGNFNRIFSKVMFSQFCKSVFVISYYGILSNVHKSKLQKISKSKLCCAQIEVCQHGRNLTS